MMPARLKKSSASGDAFSDDAGAQAVYGAQGVKGPLNDALLQWEKEQTEGLSDPFAGLENALLIVSQ